MAAFFQSRRFILLCGRTATGLRAGTPAKRKKRRKGYSILRRPSRAVCCTEVLGGRPQRAATEGQGRDHSDLSARLWRCCVHGAGLGGVARSALPSCPHIAERRCPNPPRRSSLMRDKSPSTNQPLQRAGYQPPPANTWLRHLTLQPLGGHASRCRLAPPRSQRRRSSRDRWRLELRLRPTEP